MYEVFLVTFVVTAHVDMWVRAVLPLLWPTLLLIVLEVGMMDVAVFSQRAFPVDV